MLYNGVNSMTSTFFQICSLFYVILLIFAYFSRQRVKNLENKIYSCLIINVLVELFLDLASIVTILNKDKFPVLNDIVAKSYLASLISWLSSFTLYILLISNKHRKEEIKESDLTVKFRHIVYVLGGFYFFYLIGLIFLPLNYPDVGIYSEGLAASFSYGVAGILILVSIISVLKRIKYIPLKKLVPVFIFVVIGIIAIAIQMSNPNILLISAVDAFITFLMYFTIENPDVKMIERLNLAKEQAERANQAKTEFLSSMSHEIRTPLNAIVGFSQGLLEEDLPTKSRDEVNDIISSSHNLLQIVNGILDISKIEANKLEIVNTEYCFEKIFDELVSLTRGRIGEKPIELRYQCDKTIPPVLYGDYIRIKQIVVNLLTNAVKYTKEGYVSFTVNSVCKDDICRLIISVEDSGIGIKEENIDKLFTKFERFDIERNFTIEGTGLGLAITKKLVELMNGKIVVQSKYGEGSKFTVAIDQRIIPKTIEQYNEEHAVKDINSSPFTGDGANVLVVDDNEINIKVAERLLRNYNLNITSVTSGQDCIDKVLEGNKYDLILLDDMMPKMTGIETLKNLKKIIGFNIPTVALTANAIAGMREKYLANGFDDYLSKPIDKEELDNILRKFLQKVVHNDVEEVSVNDTSMDNVNLLIENGVNVDASIELLGDMDTFNETLKDFLKESETRLKDIEKYKIDGDMPNYAILVHAMKSDAKYLGLTSLAELSYNHEMASKENNITYVNENYDILMKEASRVIDLIKKYLEKE